MTTNPNSVQITMHHYKSMLELALKRFRFAFISTLRGCSVLPTDVCFLRHDVDLSPEKALEMAQIESALGVQSTYYVLLRSPFYNALTKKNSVIWKKIMSLGHEIGIHFDPDAYSALDRTNEQWTEKLRFEVDFLQNELSNIIQSFTFHNPHAGHWDAATNKEYINLINGSCSLLTEAPFYGDSRGILKKGDFESFLSTVPHHSPLYMLIHPDWWFDEPFAKEDKIIQAANMQKENALRYWEEIATEDGGMMHLRERSTTQ